MSPIKPNNAQLRHTQLAIYPSKVVSGETIKQLRTKLDDIAFQDEDRSLWWVDDLNH